MKISTNNIGTDTMIFETRSYSRNQTDSLKTGVNSKRDLFAGIGLLFKAVGCGQCLGGHDSDAFSLLDNKLWLESGQREGRERLCGVEKDVGGWVQGWLHCRKEDEQLVEKLLPECLDELQKVWGDTTKITINKQHYLPQDSAGGVELTTKAGKIQVVSTLESRLDLIAGQVGSSLLV